MAGLGRAKTRNKDRDEEDDEHLRDALVQLRGRRRHPDNSKVMIWGPEHPPPSHFPSWSRDFDQSIPMKKFRPFLQLMIVLNLYHSGIDVHNFANSECLSQVEGVTDGLLGAFHTPDKSGYDISYSIFDRVIGNEMPCIFLGWPRLLGP